MTDVKMTQHYGAGFPPQLLSNASVFICPPPRNDPYPTQDLYNPVYEELSNGIGAREGSDSEAERRRGAERHGSEDEFAEDELSLPGDVTTMSRAQSSNLALTSQTLRVNKSNVSLSRKSRASSSRTSERRPKSLDRRRWKNSPRNKPKSSDFHGGLILGPFPRGYMYSEARNNPPPPEQQPAYHLPYSQPSYVMRHPHLNTYEPVVTPPRPEMTSFRPKNNPKKSSSQDSFNSDSGFSNHMSIETRVRNSEVYESSNIQRPLHPLFS